MSESATAHIGEVCSFLNGGTPSRSVSRFFDGDIPWITGADIDGPVVSSARSYITREAIEKSATNLVPAGTVLLVTRTSVGKVAIAGMDLCFSQDITALSPRQDQLHTAYLVQFLHANGELLARQARGATIKGVTREVVADLKIPLPPLPEQRRIAEVLDRAEALRAKRRVALSRLDSLTEAVFDHLFCRSVHPPVTIGDQLPDHKHGWHWELLTEVARLATGHTPDRKRPDYWGGDVPWITLTDIRRLDGSIANETTECVTDAGIENSSAVKLPAGTVCFSRTASVGFVTVMGREMATSQDFVNWVCGPRLHPIYVMHALLRSRARLRALSTGSTHKTIYFPTVEQFRILVPDSKTQQEFARRVAAVERLKAAQRASLAELDALFASLQHRAFRGEL
jgi:type I restriction enzyme, S subunit